MSMKGSAKQVRTLTENMVNISISKMLKMENSHATGAPISVETAGKNFPDTRTNIIFMYSTKNSLT